MEEHTSSAEKLVAEYIAENILFRKNGYPYASDDSFLENGVVDSVNILELVMFVEEKFNIHVEDSEIVPENFDSVAKLAAYVGSKDKLNRKPVTDNKNAVGGNGIFSSTPGMA